MSRPMTKAQQKHAINRLRQICRNKQDKIVEDLKKKHSKEQATYPRSFLTVQEAHELLKKKKLKLRDTPIPNTGYRSDKADNATLEQFFEDVVNSEGFSSFYDYVVKTYAQKEINKLIQEAQRVEDEIMLGDQEHALKLLREFAGE